MISQNLTISLLLLLSLSIVSCNKKNTPDNVHTKDDSVVVYNEMAFAQMGGYQEGNKIKFKIIDTACINGNKRAERTMKNGNYIYYIGAGIGMTDDKMQYFKNAFLKKGISIDYYFVSCLGDPSSEKFRFNCYEKAMNAGFKRKYGPAYVDSLKKDMERLHEEYIDKKYGE